MRELRCMAFEANEKTGTAASNTRTHAEDPHARSRMQQKPMSLKYAQKLALNCSTWPILGVCAGHAVTQGRKLAQRRRPWILHQGVCGLR